MNSNNGPLMRSVFVRLFTTVISSLFRVTSNAAHRYKSGILVTIPTLFTIARILCAPAIVWAIINLRWPLAFGLFSIAIVTDAVDGWLARVLHQQTYFGAALDPVADKILFISSFGALSLINTPSFSVPFWLLALIVAKEVILISGALYICFTRNFPAVVPTRLGKLTTVVQTVFISWLFLSYFLGWNSVVLYNAQIVLVTFFTISSLLQYSWITLQSYKKRGKKKKEQKRMNK